MGLMIKFLPVLIFVVSIATESFAAWQGPVEIMNGVWGSGVGLFGLEEGDNGDDCPTLEVITPDGKIVISDTVNKKQLVFKIDGNLIKEVKWVTESQSGGSTTYDIPEYSFKTVFGYSNDGNIYSSTGNNYYLYLPTGQQIKIYSTRPPELGVVSEIPLGNGQYKVIVTYPDRVWSILGEGIAPPYIRDINGNLYSQGDTQVIRWNFCGKELARLTMPIVEDGADFEEYGSPVVASNGDVYTWKRTEDKYSILKWTWMDDPSVLSSPDVPANLKVAAAATGLYLTWSASPQDPGCVTGYEIARSTSAGGIYTVLTTVAKGVLKYTNTTALVDTTYYYKIRAKSGNDFSPYTAEVSGKR